MRANKGKPWAPDDGKLRAMMRAGFHKVDIARRLDRSVAAVESRIKQLGGNKLLRGGAVRRPPSDTRPRHPAGPPWGGVGLVKPDRRLEECLALAGERFEDAPGAGGSPRRAAVTSRFTI